MLLLYPKRSHFHSVKNVPDQTSPVWRLFQLRAGHTEFVLQPTSDGCYLHEVNTEDRLCLDFEFRYNGHGELGPSTQSLENEFEQLDLRLDLSIMVTLESVEKGSGLPPV